MRTLASIIAVFFLTLALSGCGGDSGCGHVTSGSGTGSGSGSVCGTGTGTGTGGNTSPTVSTLTVTSSTASIPTDGSSTATITVLAKDANNNAMSGVAVTLSASAGTLKGAAATTATDGTITATLSGAGVAAGQAITVTATSGSVSNKTTVNVVANQQTITLLASLPQMPSANTKPVTITAIVQGANNQLLPGVPVTFQVTSGAIAPTQTTAGAGANPAVPAGTTDANGVATATLSTPGNPANRTLTVTATAGSTSATVQVAVINTQLSISGPGTLVQSTQGNYSISLVDSGSNGIANQTVTLASALGNTLSAPTVTTDATGAAIFTLTATASGKDTITGTWQGVSGTQTVTVSDQKFSITAPAVSTPPVSVPVNTAQTVTISWANGSGPVSTGTVQLTTSRGTLTASSSPVSGGAMTTAISISSTTAGPAIISATAIDGTGATAATAQVAINFVATTPHSLSLQASPSAVTLQGQSTLTASVTDPTGNPVSNVTVGFTLTDPTGGQLSAASATTNSQGQATVTYKASTISSAPNGVTVTAQVQGTTISGTTTLTVGGQTVFLSLGTGNLISPYSTTQYSAPYTVQAVDAAGNGVSNVAVTFSVKSVAYAMGQEFYRSPPGSWLLPVYSQTAVSTNGFAGFCPATQVLEYNGIINPTPAPTGVTPVLTSIPGSVVSTDVGQANTGPGGTATVNLIYPRDHAYWVEVALTATATVSGTQNSTTANFVLLGLASDYTSQTVSPPGQVSPYGQGTSCY